MSKVGKAVVIVGLRVLKVDDNEYDLENKRKSEHTNANFLFWTNSQLYSLIVFLYFISGSC